MHLVLGVLAATALSLLISLALVHLVRRYGVRYRIQGTGDVEGIYMVALATLYGIFVAFLIFATWTRYYDTTESAGIEANTLVNVSRLAESLPEPSRSRLHQACIEYAETMIRYEWPAMALGKQSPEGRHAARQMWPIFNAMNLGSTSDVLHDHLLTEFTSLISLRQNRLLHAEGRLPNILLALMIFGALMTVLFAAVFSVEDLAPHALKTCVLALMISFMLYTVWELDAPFQGDVRIRPTAFQHALEIIKEAN